MQPNQGDIENRESLAEVLGILRYENRQDLSALLADAYVVYGYLDTLFPLTGGEAQLDLVEASIYAPISSCKALRELPKEDEDLIRNALQETYPYAESGGMVIQIISFNINTDSPRDGLTSLFEGPIGWHSVDQKMNRIREQLMTASTEEHFQELGVQCRQGLIAVAQSVFDSKQHPALANDTTDAGKNDVKRMVARYVAAECPGPSRAEIRKCVNSAVDLANTVTHSTTSTHMDAVFCAQATVNVIGLLAVISGKRDRVQLRDAVGSSDQKDGRTA